ncbi:MAG: hypothetical protein ACOYB8_05585 [Eubacteriaceae bacterium]|jgi:hypothetical protein
MNALIFSSTPAWHTKKCEGLPFLLNVLKGLNIPVITGEANPDADSYMDTAQAAGHSIADCTVIENTVEGIYAAAEAGAGTIAVIDTDREVREQLGSLPEVKRVYENYYDFYHDMVMDRIFS